MSVTTNAKDRNQTIVRTSIIGILANIFLAITKAVIGLLSHSIAVVLDAVNNFSDVLSSVITIVGARLANKKPDREHPYGHGRAEYLSAMIVAAIVLYAGITALIESVKKIITPEVSDYSTLSLILIALAVLVKVVLGNYVKAQGKKVDSNALIASGSDALFDAILSSSVLASAIIFLKTGISLEAYVGVVISGFIIKSGIEMMKDTIGDVLGKRIDSDISKQVKEIINGEDAVYGAYDLFINDYGPNRNYASVHVELPSTMSVEEVDKLTRRIAGNVYQKTGVILTGIGVYSNNAENQDIQVMRDKITKLVMAHDWAIQVHAFHVDLEEKVIRFDVVTTFDIEPKDAVIEITKEVKQKYPDYSIMVTHDVDVTD